MRMALDAYPRSDHGQALGRLLRIEPGADEAGFFRVWASLDRVEREDKLSLHELRPGLELTAEVIIDQRSLLDFALRPFKKLADPLSVSE